MNLRPIGRRAMTLFIIPVLSLWGSHCFAQGKQFKDLPAVTPADFTIPSSPAVDSNSNAVILAKVGEIHFVGNENGWFSHVYSVHERIKILNKKAFEAATVRVNLYSPSEDPEKIDKLVASTFNLENGQLTEVQLDKKDIFEERGGNHWKVMKWTMPAVREGSIIDFSYIITSTYNSWLPSWTFQSEPYPSLYSAFQVDIPATLMYTVIKQGIHAYAVDKGSEGSETYRVGRKSNSSMPVDDNSWMSVYANTIRHQWVMKDIPAFQEEPFLTTPSNYVDKLDFQLARTYNGEDYSDYYNNWKQATEQLLGNENFGKGLDDDNQAIGDLEGEAVSGATGLAEQAKAIYYYICQHFTCDDFNDQYIRTSLSDVVKNRRGTVGDINLLLIAMLRKLGVQADPVVLSTRDFGFSLANYPVLARLNYVIARAMIKGNIFYLDAAHPKLGFGQLDENCYNGPARIISRSDSGSVYFDTDSLKERTATVVFISQTDKGSEGTWTSTLGPEKSYELRELIGETGKEAYFKNIQTALGNDIQISDGHFDSLDRPEMPVTVHYSFDIRQEAGESKMYINPFFDAGVHQNPFKAADRKYPVEMDNASDDLYVFTMQIPDGYSVEELPKSARASLNGQEGSFEYLAGGDDGMVQIRCHLKLNKANFPPDDYNTLREFYSMIVKKEAEVIVLKKN